MIWLKRRVRLVHIVLGLLVVLVVGGLWSISFDVTPESHGKPPTAVALKFEEPPLEIYKPVIVSQKKKPVSGFFSFVFCFLFLIPLSPHVTASWI